MSILIEAINTLNEFPALESRKAAFRAQSLSFSHSLRLKSTFYWSYNGRGLFVLLHYKKIKKFIVFMNVLKHYGIVLKV